jgi:RNA polymerase sigma-70 factor, ECF subfamily
MASQTPDSAMELTLLGATDSALPAVPRAVEEEVVILFDQFRDPLLRYVVSLGVYAHDGEDVIQDVFLSLFRHLRLGRSRANLRGWIFRVAHNLALKQRTQTQRQQVRMAPDEGLLESQFDPTTNPEEQLATSQRQKQLLLVVAALAEHDQWCLYLRAEGLRYREIAEVLGMSLGAVSNSLARSMARLARADER